MPSSPKFYIVLFGVFCLSCAHCCAADNGQQTTTAPAPAGGAAAPAAAGAAPKTVDNGADQLDQEAIMQMCNESFRTSMEYLEELNTTGAFPDETDKTPMCYIRCYLDGVGIIKDDELNREKATEMAWATADDTLDECEKEVTDRTNPCEKAYFLTRCVMMRNIVDMRTGGNQ